MRGSRDYVDLFSRYVAIGGAALETLATVALAFVGVAMVTQLLMAWSQYVGEDLGWTAKSPRSLRSSRDSW